MAYSEQYKRILHRFGYYDYQQGLIHRHLSQEEGWNIHLRNCRNYILKAVNEIKPVKVTVLGSGWLLDIPLAEILETVRTVNLIDIIHPPEAKKQIASLPGVILTEDDVTGGLVEEIWEKTRRTALFRKPDNLDNIIIPEYELKDDPGLIISLNILSQLDVLPVELLRKKTRVTEMEITRFRKMVQGNHIRFLSKHRSLLISDICEIFTASSGETTEEQTVIADIPAGKNREEWIWDFDLRSSDFNKKSSVLKVIALTLTE